MVIKTEKPHTTFIHFHCAISIAGYSFWMSNKISMLSWENNGLGHTTHEWYQELAIRGDEQAGSQEYSRRSSGTTETVLIQTAHA